MKISEERCGSSPTPENQEEFELLKMEYDSIYEQIAKGAIIRSKATWYEKGEKSNKFFLNLETHKKAKSSVRKVFDDNVDSLNYSYDHGELSNSQKEAIITLIEKKDKDKRDLSNWRPISLINVDVKIGSKAIAKRLENVLPNIIHFNQSAYVKGRTIFDAVRTIEFMVF